MHIHDSFCLQCYSKNMYWFIFFTIPMQYSANIKKGAHLLCIHVMTCHLNLLCIFIKYTFIFHNYTNRNVRHLAAGFLCFHNCTFNMKIMLVIFNSCSQVIRRGNTESTQSRMLSEGAIRLLSCFIIWTRKKKENKSKTKAYE